MASAADAASARDAGGAGGGSKGDADLVRPGGQEGSGAGGTAQWSTGGATPSIQLDPAQRAALGSRVIFLGTSLTAGVFGRCGYFVGNITERHMREGDAGNPFGYFEADDVIAKNVELFQRAGFKFHNTWLFYPITEAAIDRM